jgi:hypothetical protein
MALYGPLTAEQRALLEQRFWPKVRVIDGDGCWEWQAGCANSGYGQMQIRSIDPMPILAHRVAWILQYGQIDDGMHVLHRCDNRRCCRWDHLFQGTQADNNRDRTAKGRTASGDRNGARTRPERNPFIANGGSGLRGEAHPQSKLTDAQVQAIIQDARIMRHAHVAKKYGISQTHVIRLVRGDVRK